MGMYVYNTVHWVGDFKNGDAFSQFHFCIQFQCRRIQDQCNTYVKKERDRSFIWRRKGYNQWPVNSQNPDVSSANVSAASVLWSSKIRCSTPRKTHSRASCQWLAGVCHGHNNLSILPPPLKTSLDVGWSGNVRRWETTTSPYSTIRMRSVKYVTTWDKWHSAWKGKTKKREPQKTCVLTTRTRPKTIFDHEYEAKVYDKQQRIVQYT